ncbi:hypothetical protein AB1N83_007195 [Pleurotus pulmonarius]
MAHSPRQAIRQIALLLDEVDEAVRIGKCHLHLGWYVKGREPTHHVSEVVLQIFQKLQSPQARGRMLGRFF